MIKENALHQKKKKSQTKVNKKDMSVTFKYKIYVAGKDFEIELNR